MPAKKKTDTLTSLQKFEPVTVWRSEIKTADYNPRKISEEARKRLKANLKKVGMLDLVIVNRATMNVVGGHQRLSIIDEVEKYPGKDYQLTVSMVMLTEQQEKEQNIFLNSKSAQGEFDNDLLAAMLVDIDVAAAGLSDMDVALLQSTELPEMNTDDLDEFFTKKPKASKEWDEEDQIGKDQAANAVKSAKAEIKESAGKKAGNNLLAYLTLNFKDMAGKTAFMERFGLDPYLSFTDGEEFSDMCEVVM